MSVPPQAMRRGQPQQQTPQAPQVAPIEAAAQIVGQTALQISQMQGAITQQLQQLVASVNQIANSSVIRPFNSLAEAMVQTVQALTQTNQALMSFSQAMVQSLEVIQVGQKQQSDAMVKQINKIAMAPIAFDWDKDGRVRTSRRELSEEERIVGGMTDEV